MTQYGMFVELADIENAPTVDVVGRQWIPVSERLPKNDDWVIVTILDESGDTPWRYTDFGWYLEEANCWIVASEQRKDIVAWMSLPEPWKKEKQ